jgi:hypothetical protein
VKFVAVIDGDPLPTVQWLCNGKQVVPGGYNLVRFLIYKTINFISYNKYNELISVRK